MLRGGPRELKRELKSKMGFEGLLKAFDRFSKWVILRSPCLFHITWSCSPYHGGGSITITSTGSTKPGMRDLSGKVLICWGVEISPLLL